VFFGLRLLLQFNLFRLAEASLMGVVQFLTGWPVTIILLIVSYLDGTWWLRNLGGWVRGNFPLRSAVLGSGEECQFRVAGGAWSLRCGADLARSAAGALLVDENNTGRVLCVGK
jgi:UPF0716 family protein affecting phage T7 exclusion